MADSPNPSNNWWATVPGVLTALAAVIGAIGTLITTIHQLNSTPSQSPKPESVVQSLPAAAPAPKVEVAVKTEPPAAAMPTVAVNTTPALDAATLTALLSPPKQQDAVLSEANSNKEGLLPAIPVLRAPPAKWLREDPLRPGHFIWSADPPLSLYKATPAPQAKPPAAVFRGTPAEIRKWLREQPVKQE